MVLVCTCFVSRIRVLQLHLRSLSTPSMKVLVLMLSPFFHSHRSAVKCNLFVRHRWCLKRESASERGNMLMRVMNRRVMK